MQNFAYHVYNELDKPDNCEFEDGCDQESKLLTENKKKKY